MRVLFDQGTPAPLRRDLPQHLVETAHERGWTNLRNGDLLRAAEDAGFEAFALRRTLLPTPWLDVQRSISSRSAFREDAEQRIAVDSRATEGSLRTLYLIRLQLNLERYTT